MKPPSKTLADLAKLKPKREAADMTYAPPTPMVARRAKAKVLTPAEKAAFLASRPDLKPKS